MYVLICRRIKLYCMGMKIHNIILFRPEAVGIRIKKYNHNIPKEEHNIKK